MVASSRRFPRKKEHTGGQRIPQQKANMNASRSLPKCCHDCCIGKVSSGQLHVVGGSVGWNPLQNELSGIGVFAFIALERHVLQNEGEYPHKQQGLRSAEANKVLGMFLDWLNTSIEFASQLQPWIYPLAPARQSCRRRFPFSFSELRSHARNMSLAGCRTDRGPPRGSFDPIATDASGFWRNQRGALGSWSLQRPSGKTMTVR